MFPQRIIKIELSFPFSLPLSSAVCFFLSENARICPVSRLVPFNFPTDHSMVPPKVTADLTDTDMRFQTQFDHLPFKAGKRASLHTSTGYADSGLSAPRWCIEY